MSLLTFLFSILFHEEIFERYCIVVKCECSENRTSFRPYSCLWPSSQLVTDKSCDTVPFTHLTRVRRTFSLQGAILPEHIFISSAVIIPVYFVENQQSPFNREEQNLLTCLISRDIHRQLTIPHLDIQRKQQDSNHRLISTKFWGISCTQSTNRCSPHHIVQITLVLSSPKLL